MRSRVFPAALALAFLLAAPVYPGDQESYECGLPTQECLDMMAAYYRDAGWVGLEYDQVSSEELVVTRVVPESPAVAAGFQVGDRLLAMNGVRFAEENAEALKKMQKQKKPGVKFTFTVGREGKEIELSVVLGRMPDDVISTAIGQHMMEHVTKAEDQEEEKEQEQEEEGGS
jgi:predicted metalloprotease with PDZ domain